ncbi:MAG: GcrA family cell cycle regulator [Hyphomicrobiales bacterium]|nr:GcrA family cell cycle regulator [Hyphomicrobiales bacterium]
MSWTDERVEVLKKLWTDGLSASQIAGRIGGGVTRNAVIGKVHRLGLAGRATTSRMRSARPRARILPFPQRAPAVQYRTQGSAALKALLAPEYKAEVHVLPLPTPEDLAVAVGERIALLELKECMCRWPIGDPQDEQFRFCGRKTAAGATYCEHHSAIAYQPTQRRRQQPREVVYA